MKERQCFQGLTWFIFIGAPFARRRFACDVPSALPGGGGVRLSVPLRDSVTSQSTLAVNKSLRADVDLLASDPFIYGLWRYLSPSVGLAVWGAFRRE